MIPTLVASGNAELGQFDSLRMDDIEDEVDEAIEVTRRRWEQDNTLADILALASVAATRMINSTGRQFNASVQRTTGQARFFPEPSGTAARIKTFAKRNRELISNAISDQVARIKQTIVGGIAASRPVSAIRKGIVKAAKTFGRRLVNIARDQSEKIQSQINTARMKVMGIKKFRWISQADDRVRPHHEEINGKIFEVGKGDPEDGMPGDAVNCFLGETMVWSPTPISKHFSRLYRGDIVVLSLKDRTIKVTPNHPILTLDGFKPAGEIDETDYLVNVSVVDRLGASHDHSHETRIDEIGDLVEGVLSRFSAARFHGDLSVDDEVDIKFVDGSLGLDIPTPSKESLLKHFLSEADTDGLSHADRLGSLHKLFMAVIGPAPGVVSRGGPRFPLLGSSDRHPRLHALASVSDMNTSAGKPPDDHGSGDADLAGDSENGLVTAISADKVLNVARFFDSCHVYNLETKSGWYVANGVLVSNCRCIAGVIVPKGATPAQRATIEKNRERRLKATNRPAPEKKPKATPKAKAAPKPKPAPKKKSETQRLRDELAALKKGNASRAKTLKATQDRTKKIRAETRKAQAATRKANAETAKQKEEIAALEKKIKDTEAATKRILTQAGIRPSKKRLN